MEKVSQGVFQPVRREAGGVVVGDGVAVIVADVRRIQTVSGQNCRHLRRGGDDGGCVRLCGLLAQVVPMEKVHGVGEHGGGHVVEQRGGGLGRAGGKVPDDMGGAGAVVPPGVGQRAGKEGEGGILASAVHPHVRQPPQRRRVQ